MDHPFIFNGKNCGNLSIVSDGVYTVFHISAAGIVGDIVRLSIYGDDREFYLGLAQVHDGKLDFVKKFSRASISDLPEMIEFASESGMNFRNLKDEKPLKHLDGPYILHDEYGDFLAIPTTVERPYGSCRIKVIKGRRYMLFRY